VRRVSAPAIRGLRKRVQVANERAEADPTLSIGYRHKVALEVLLTSKSCSHIHKCCVTLGTHLDRRVLTLPRSIVSHSSAILCIAISCIVI
jgi:hypothetical protein